MRFIAATVFLVASVTTWAGITIGVNNLSVVHKSSNGVTIAFPDVCKTPAPSGPIPIPYPNIAKSTDTEKGVKRTKAAALEKSVDQSREARLSSAATVSAGDAAVYALEVQSGGKVTIKQTAERDSVTTATYVDGKGNELQLREHALIKLANGELCAICVAQNGKVTAVYRLLPEAQHRKARPPTRDMR